MIESNVLKEVNYTVIPYFVTRLNNTKKDYTKFVKRFENYLEKLLARMEVFWEKEEKKDIKSITRDSGLKKFERWSNRTSNLRSHILKELNDKFYNDLWFLRAELELVYVSLKLDNTKDYIKFDRAWEINVSNNEEPIVVRISKPKKPKKKRFSVADVQYDIQKNINKMLKPLHDEILQIKEMFKTIKLPKELLEIETKIAQEFTETSSKFSDKSLKEYNTTIRKLGKSKPEIFNTMYKDVFMIRNRLTSVTQAMASRITFTEFKENVLDDLS
jgi:hypothetical protein